MAGAQSASEAYGGRYAVIERVGVGGMAEVYRARDQLLGREVALKVLSARLSNDRSFVERFRREAQSAANLNHPNIVSLYDYGGEDGTYYIVMEYIDGRPLDEIIRTEGPLLPERAAEIASDVALALERAHATGLVHRDIKPSNIMVTNHGQTKVTDFGIARALTRNGEQTVTQTGMVIGTAAYLSPEQAQGNPVDGRSDVYALGCVLNEMLTGHAPFSGDTPLSIAYKHVREDPTPPSQVNADVPPELEAVVMKALAKNPENRYSSAADMHQDLQRFLSGQSVEAPPIMAASTMVGAPVGDTQILRDRTQAQPPAEPEPGKKRGPWFWALMTLLILALFGALAWLIADQLLGQPVRVPDVVGRQAEDAQQALERVGLESEIRRQDRAGTPEGEVFRQDPEAGRQLEEGETVTLFVSSGPPPTRVPDVTGKEQKEAERLLREAHLKVGRVETRNSADVPEGVVISQSVDPRERVERGTRVNLVVSEGPRLVEVEDTIGLPEDQAIDVLEGQGFAVDVDRTFSDEYEEGVVAFQQPGGGALVEPGSTVVISVSEGPEPIEMPNVIGQDADDAEAQLEELGLSVSQETADEPCGAQ